MIPFFRPFFTNEMKDAAIHALQNETYIMGESVHKFEEEFAKYIGTKHAISVNSGYSALYLSLIALGITNNSKVITSTNSFIASANCVLGANARPVLADVYLKDGNIDITKHRCADAVIPVHIFGNPCNVESIRAFAEANSCPIIEDACQAHGASVNGEKVGSIGDVGCFSFYPTKNMTVCGDGGMITTNYDNVHESLVSLRDNGRKSKNEFDKLGFTMRLNTVSAAIGRVQLRYLDSFNSRRREIKRMYESKIHNITMLEENGTAVYHQIVIKSDKRDKIKDHLTKNGIDSAIHYQIPIHKQELYKKYGYVLPNAEELSRCVLSLPAYPLLSDDEVKTICEKVNEVTG